MTESRGPRQREIPGTERKRDKKLDGLASDVYELTAKRLSWHEKEKAARVKLNDAMKKKGIEAYLWVDGEERYDVERTETEKVSVKKAKAEA